MEKIKKLFQTTGTKQGSFSIGVTAIVIAIVVVANMIRSGSQSNIDSTGCEG